MRRQEEVQKGSRKCGGLDVEAARRHEEVQKEAKACGIVLHKILVNEYSACYNIQVYFVYTAQALYIQERLSIYGVPCIHR